MEQVTNKIYFSKENDNYGFLSNFYSQSFEYNDMMWPTSEHAYQAMKSPHKEVHEWIRKATSPDEAKRRGRRIAEIREDWDEVKYFFMRDIVHAKFCEPSLREKLLDTNDLELVEYAPWGDTYWGVDKNYNGENNLGKILMEIRDLFRSEDIKFQEKVRANQ